MKNYDNIFRPTTITLIYVVVATLWIFLTDSIILSIVESEQMLSQFQTAKGIVYVLLTASMLYSLILTNNRRLKQREGQYHTLFDQAMLGIITFNVKEIIRCNKQFEKILGYNESDLKGEHLKTLIHPDHQVMFSQMLDKLLIGVVEDRYEFKVLTRDDDERWVSFSATTLNAKVKGEEVFVGFVQDITLERRYQNYSNLLMEIILILNPNDPVDEAMESVLKRIGDYINWQYGEIWVPSNNNNHLRLLTHWKKRDVDLDYFVAQSSNVKFSNGEGLPGRVWETKKIEWLNDLKNESLFKRHNLIDGIELGTLVGFPILVNNEVIAVVTLFSKQKRQQASELMTFLMALSNDIGIKLEAKFQQEAREKAVEQLRFALESAQIGTWQINFDRGTVTGNDIFYDLIGEKSDIEIDLVDYQTKIHPDDLETVKHKVENARDTHTDYLSEHRIKVTDEDTYKWFWSRGRVLSIEEDGEQVSVLSGMLIEIEQRKQAEKQLKKSEENYRQVFNNSPMPLIVFNIKSCTILNVNLAAERFYGYSEKEFSSMSCEEIFTDESWANTNLTISNTDILEGEDYTLLENSVHKRKNGNTFYANLYVRSHISGEDPTCIMLVQDVTNERIYRQRLEESEQKYRTLFNKSPLIHLIADIEDYHLLDVNNAAVQQYGLAPNNYSGTILSDLFAEQYKSDADILIDEVKKRETIDMESHHIKEGEDDMVVQIVAGIIDYKDKEAILVTCNDISRQKQAEDKILSSIIEGGDMERERIAQELHDGLGQYLTAASLNLRSLRKEQELLSENKQKQLKQGLLFLDHAIDDIRDMAHNLMPKSIGDFGLVVALNSLIKGLNNASSTDIKFIENFEGDLRFERQTEIHIYRIIQEAVSNILKHAAASKAVVQLMYFQSQNELTLTIEDNGMGFNVDDEEHHIEGMGLKNIRNRVKSLSGTLEMNSKEGKGTQYMITFENLTLK